jgi:hypothetical protein
MVWYDENDDLVLWWAISYCGDYKVFGALIAMFWNVVCKKKSFDLVEFYCAVCSFSNVWYGVNKSLVWYEL